jgi:hypothetical protein
VTPHAQTTTEHMSQGQNKSTWTSSSPQILRQTIIFTTFLNKIYLFLAPLYSTRRCIQYVPTDTVFSVDILSARGQSPLLFIFTRHQSDYGIDCHWHFRGGLFASWLWQVWRRYVWTQQRPLPNPVVAKRLIYLRRKSSSLRFQAGVTYCHTPTHMTSRRTPTSAPAAHWYLAVDVAN